MDEDLFGMRCEAARDVLHDARNAMREALEDAYDLDSDDGGCATHPAWSMSDEMFDSCIKFFDKNHWWHLHWAIQYIRGGCDASDGVDIRCEYIQQWCVESYQAFLLRGFRGHARWTATEEQLSAKQPEKEAEARKYRLYGQPEAEADMMDTSGGVLGPDPIEGTLFKTSGLRSGKRRGIQLLSPFYEGIEKHAKSVEDELCRRDPARRRRRRMCEPYEEPYEEPWEMYEANTRWPAGPREQE